MEAAFNCWRRSKRDIEMSHDIATDETPPHEPVTNFRLTEWAAKNWAIVAFILMVLGSGMNAYAIQFINTAGVTRREYEQSETKFTEYAKASLEFRTTIEAAIKLGNDTNARQDQAIAGLQQAVTDTKDDNREIKGDIKQLLKLVK
jgi:hypothetical protein